MTLHGSLTNICAILSGDPPSPTALAVLCAVCALAVIGLCLMLIQETRRRKALESQATKTRRYEEQFRIAAQQSGRRVLRYDIMHDVFRRHGAEGSDNACGGVAEAIVAAGRITEESLADYHEFFQRLRAGESPLTAELLLEKESGLRRWYRFETTTLFGKDGRPETAIISYFDDTEQRERGIAHAKWKQELALLQQRRDASVHEWNISRNICENGMPIEYMPPIDAWEEQKFDERARTYSEKLVLPEDRPAYQAFMQRERLIGAYYDGARKEALDYRMQLPDGSVRWRRVTVQMVQYPGSGDIKAFLMLEDIHAEKERENRLREQSERDALTGALNRSVFIEKVTALLREYPNASHALLMLDLDEFKLINDALGHDVGDTVLSEMVRHVRSTLRASDFIGRIGGDEFLICLRDIPYDAAISDKAERLCNVLSRTVGDGWFVSVSIGIAVFPRDGVAFDTLYKCADTAMYQAKFNGRNRFEFYSKTMETAPGLLTVRDEEGAQARPRILICASEAMCASLKELLDERYDVCTACDMDAAASQFGNSHGRLALVIYDLDSVFGDDPALPCFDNAARLGLPSFALTSRYSEDDLLQIINAGAKNIMQKPFRERLFLARIAQIVFDRNRAAQQLQSSYARLHQSDEERYRALLNATGTAVFIYDPETRAYTADPMINKYIAGSFDGRFISDVLRQDEVAREEDIERGNELSRSVFNGERQSVEMNILCRTPQNEYRWFCVKIFRLKSYDEMTQKILLTINDVHKQVKAEEELRFRAERDALTGLYNRATFFAIATEMIAQREPGYYILSCFDVESFQAINDRFGTDIGDEVLQHIASTVDRVVRDTGGIACRISADNFAGIFPASESDSIGVIAQSYDRAISIGDTELYVTLSVGRYTVDDLSLPVGAMYDRALLAKRTIKGRYDQHTAFYSESMRAGVLREQEITREADHALRTGEFSIHLQPQFDHATGALIGAEALARWQHPSKGMIFPGVCVPIFERNGFIFTLDRYIWEQSCRELRRWLDEGRSPLPIAVNVSRKDVYHFDFYDVITGLVEEYGLPAELMALEITESAFAEAPSQIIDMVKRLRAYGFVIEIDDFGSGYSSLNTLKDVPADILKLDMQFLKPGDNQARSRMITESVIDMANRLHMPVIAEGVETKAQADYLLSVGCSYVQGYLYAKPMPVSEFEALWLRSRVERVKLPPKNDRQPPSTAADAPL